jgi:hypothetical protein
VTGVQTCALPIYTFLTEFYIETPDMPTFPHAGMLPANTNYGNCSECFQASLGCDDNLENCAGDYLATSGSYSFTAATRKTDAGVFIGEGTNLTFRKWNFTSDRPDGTACFTVPKLVFKATWTGPVDAGMSADAGSRDGG